MHVCMISVFDFLAGEALVAAIDGDDFGFVNGGVLLRFGRLVP